MTWPEQIVVGQYYERLLILERIPRDEAPSRHRWYRAQCTCGTIVDVAGPRVAKGETRSCGCKRRDKSAAHCVSRGTHGHYVGGKPSRTYRSWASMLTRATNPNFTGSRYYKHVSVCDRWRQFEAFLEDMGERPVGTSLDRIDPWGDYEPGNCRWATPIEQRHNRRDERDLTTP